MQCARMASSGILPGLLLLLFLLLYLPFPWRLARLPLQIHKESSCSCKHGVASGAAEGISRDAWPSHVPNCTPKGCNGSDTDRERAPMRSGLGRWPRSSREILLSHSRQQQTMTSSNKVKMSQPHPLHRRSIPDEVDQAMNAMWLKREQLSFPQKWSIGPVLQTHLDEMRARDTRNLVPGLEHVQPPPQAWNYFVSPSGQKGAIWHEQNSRLGHVPRTLSQSILPQPHFQGATSNPVTRITMHRTLSGGHFDDLRADKVYARYSGGPQTMSKSGLFPRPGVLAHGPPPLAEARIDDLLNGEGPKETNEALSGSTVSRSKPGTPEPLDQSSRPSYRDLLRSRQSDSAKSLYGPPDRIISPIPSSVSFDRSTHDGESLANEQSLQHQKDSLSPSNSFQTWRKFTQDLHPPRTASSFTKPGLFKVDEHRTSEQVRSKGNQNAMGSRLEDRKTESSLANDYYETKPSKSMFKTQNIQGEQTSDPHGSSAVEHRIRMRQQHDALYSRKHGQFLPEAFGGGELSSFGHQLDQKSESSRARELSDQISLMSSVPPRKGHRASQSEQEVIDKIRRGDSSSKQFKRREWKTSWTDEKLLARVGKTKPRIFNPKKRFAPHHRAAMRVREGYPHDFDPVHGMEAVVKRKIAEEMGRHVQLPWVTDEWFPDRDMAHRGMLRTSSIDQPSALRELHPRVPLEETNPRQQRVAKTDMKRTTRLPFTQSRRYMLPQELRNDAYDLQDWEGRRAHFFTSGQNLRQLHPHAFTKQRSKRRKTTDPFEQVVKLQPLMHKTLSTPLLEMARPIQPNALMAYGYKDGGGPGATGESFNVPRGGANAHKSFRGRHGPRMMEQTERANSMILFHQLHQMAREVPPNDTLKQKAHNAAFQEMEQVREMRAKQKEQSALQALYAEDKGTEKGVGKTTIKVTDHGAAPNKASGQRSGKGGGAPVNRGSSKSAGPLRKAGQAGRAM